jgi:hypothetical protein
MVTRARVARQAEVAFAAAQEAFGPQPFHAAVHKLREVKKRLAQLKI